MMKKWKLPIETTKEKSFGANLMTLLLPKIKEDSEVSICTVGCIKTQKFKDQLKSGCFCTNLSECDAWKYNQWMKLNFVF